MKTIFLCKECKIQLSNELKGPIEDDKKIYIDREDHIPKGSFGICTNDFMIQFQNEYIINLQDKINVKYTNDHSRRNGCCGHDGQGGINTLCKNDHEIGTECSDCWMSHGIIFHKNKVIKKNIY